MCHSFTYTHRVLAAIFSLPLSVSFDPTSPIIAFVAIDADVADHPNLWLSYRGVTAMDDTHGRAQSPSGSNAAAQPQRSDVSTLEQDQSLALLFDVSRELTSVLARDELLQRIAD